MLTFYYGTMNSSKTAQALMTRFNYLQKDFDVLLLKPEIDTRYENGKNKVIARIGLSADCIDFSKQDDLIKICNENFNDKPLKIIIIDECQFCTKNQIEQLKDLSLKYDCLCYGLLINFKSELFEASKRLIELADEIHEIKAVCRCGKKATINARLCNGKIVTDGNEIEIGAEDKYEAMCYFCYKEKIKKQNENNLVSISKKG